MLARRRIAALFLASFSSLATCGGEESQLIDLCGGDAEYDPASGQCFCLEDAREAGGVDPTRRCVSPFEERYPVPFDDPRLVAWAKRVVEYLPGSNVVGARWRETDQAIGPASNSATQVLCLGNGGSATLWFDPPIADGPGWDFAVFENAFAIDVFLELAFVEVSSDGRHFLRFDSEFGGSSSVRANSSPKASEIDGVAGLYSVGEGTPFDVAKLRGRSEVKSGLVDLRAIAFVRIVDIVGDGMTCDSSGMPIIDPLDGGPTGGFDLDAVGVIHQRR